MAPSNPTTSQLDFSFEEPQSNRRIWPVRELVSQARELVERKYADVWVEGEISNLRPAPSGHIYFTLKDADAQLPVVLFRRQAILLRFRPEDGLHVLVRGRVSIYEQRGQMQLVAETMEPVGAGSLQLAFEQLKQRLKAEGLFDVDRKQPLPAFPRTVGIVTSPTGAVIRDFLSIVARRHSGLSVLILPVSVQGDSAPSEIEAAITQFNLAGTDLNGPTISNSRSGHVDVIVLARGGGSLEDLAAFNSERVARAIAASRLPVVSAVGHETDFTIADFVADLRAPTPSAAAELITEAQHNVAERVENLVRRLDRATSFQLLQARQRLTRLPVARSEARISTLLHRSAQRLDDLSLRLETSVTAITRQRQAQVAALAVAVLHHNPRQSLAHARERLYASSTRMQRSIERTLQRSAARLGALDARLNSLSPLAVLERGYALVLTPTGTLIRSTSQVTPGDKIRTRLADGEFTSSVESSEVGKSAVPKSTSRKPRKN